MRTTISVRHCEISEPLRERARAVAARLAELSPHALDARVVFDAVAAGRSVEIRLRARGRKMLVGSAEGSDHRSALDRAEEKLRPQLMRAVRALRRSRRAPSRAP